MKNPIKFLSLLTVTGFILTSCEGPMGPAGKDGLDGLAGKDANETCKLCHNSTSVDLLSVQYEFSKHGYGEAAFEESGNTGCSPCHAQEAFKYVVKNNTPVAFVNTAGVYSNPYSASSSSAYGEIGCSTCHSSLHTTFTGAEFFPLTTTAAVPLTMWSGTKTINLTQKGGESNLCVKCHQPRPFTRSNTTDKNVLNYAGLVSAPTAVFYDAAQSNTLNVLKPSYRTHTHYGTAGAVYAGQGGVEFGTGYSNSWHTTGASCQDCHMAPITGRAGGHTFVAKGNFNGCNVTGCHSATPITSATTTKYWKLTRDAVKLKLDQLAAKLTINGVDILNRNPNTNEALGGVNLWAGMTTNNYDGYLNIYDPITNPTGQTYNAKSFQYIGTPASTWTQAQKDYNATLPLITLTNAQMGALINFQLCLRDYSLGIHNTAYTATLLTNSIAALP
ncbi:MAG: ammonia-forming cytochrome c nitrite reductase subunit c552 [Bacteroidota bacterium]